MNQVLYERNLLYNTGIVFDPGSISVKIYGPDNSLRIITEIECRTNHSPLKYLDEIVEILGNDIFSKIKIDVRKDIVMYFKGTGIKYAMDGNSKYIRVYFDNNVTVVDRVEEIRE